MALLAWLVFFGWLGHAVVPRLLCFSAPCLPWAVCFCLLVWLLVSCFWFRAFGCWVLLVAGRLDAFRLAGSWLALLCLVCFRVSLASFRWQPAGCSLLDCLLDLHWVCILELGSYCCTFFDGYSVKLFPTILFENALRVPRR